MECPMCKNILLVTEKNGTEHRQCCCCGYFLILPIHRTQHKFVIDADKQEVMDAKQ